MMMLSTLFTLGLQLSRLVTAGEDHLVRLLPAEATATNVVPSVIEDATQSVTWVDANKKFLVTASADGAVRLYQHSDKSSAELVHIVRREVLPVRCAALEKSQESPRVAICSDELLIRVVSATDPRNITLLTGHSRGVRGCSWSPTIPVLASCGSDGDLRIWDMSGSESSCIKVISNQMPGLRPESEFSSVPCWHPSGQLLAIPLKTHEVGLFRAPARMKDLQSSDVWTLVGTLGPSSETLSPELTTPSGVLAAMEFSPNGRYLATATEDLQVTIWAMDSRKVIRSYTAEALATSLSWHPHKDVLAWTDMQGQLVRWESVVGANLPNGFEVVEMTVSMAKGRDAALESDLDDLFDDGLAADDDEDLGAPQPKRLRPSHSSFSEHALSQPTFQPGSTPMVSQRRYLSLSTLGTLTCIDQDTHQTVVFDSYDTSARRNFRFTDHYGYTMASMAPQGIIFACPAESNSPSSVFYRPFDDVPGVQTEWTVNLPSGENAVAVALGGIPNVGSHADILDGSQGVADESFTSFANGVVATTKGYLRFFGPSGMQRYVWALGASVVTLAAGPHGVLVVYKSGLLHASHVHLAYLLIEFSQLSIMQQGTLPLPQEATLTWAGFNELGVPAVFDSHGVLYALDRAWRPGQGRWVPVLDCQVALQPQSASDDVSEPAAPRARCWPIGFTSTHLLGLLLPLSQRFPLATGPHPLVQELELSFCVAQRDGAAAPLEEQALRQSLLAGAIRDARAATGTDVHVSQRSKADSDPALFDMEADKALLQLVQLACKADRYGRALDAARSLHSETTLEAALKIAHFFHLPSLADRMEQIRAPLAVRQQFAPELIERSCGTDALLRNVARVRVPEAAPAAPPSEQQSAADQLQKDSFEPRAKRSSHASVLAQEGLAHLQAPDAEPTSSLPSSDWSLPPLSGTETRSESTSSMPSAPTRSNPFARTQSIAKERHWQKSQSFFERVEAPKRKVDEEATDRSEKRSASRQSTLASFAYKAPEEESDS